MSMLDKAIQAITPTESDEERAQARQEAQAAATQGDWLSLILDHHRQIENAFAAAFNASDASSRRAGCKQLGLVLTGHAIAEESVIYPALTGDKAEATMGYEEQALVKTEMAELEMLDPMGQDWSDKLAAIQEAVAHHMYKEEGDWFLELAADAPDPEMLTQRYSEEFNRYTGNDKPAMFARDQGSSG